MGRFDGSFLDGVQDLGEGYFAGLRVSLDGGDGRSGKGIRADRVAEEVLLDGLGVGLGSRGGWLVLGGGRFDDGIDCGGSRSSQHFAVRGDVGVAFGYSGGNGRRREGIFHPGEGRLVVGDAAGSRNSDGSMGAGRAFPSREGRILRRRSRFRRGGGLGIGSERAQGRSLCRRVKVKQRGGISRSIKGKPGKGMAGCAGPLRTFRRRVENELQGCIWVRVTEPASL